MSFNNHQDFLSEVSRIKDELDYRIISTRPRSSYVAILPRRILDEIKTEAEITK